VKPRLWVVGLLCDGEVETFGPFSKETAEALFKKLNAQSLGDGVTPFISALQERRPVREN